MTDHLHPVIGIDLGTTYSAVAVYNTFTQQAEMIDDPENPGKDTVPSVVSFDPLTGKVLVGAWAKNRLAVDPQNTVIEIKREMGEEFSEATLDKFGARGRFRATQREAGIEGDPVQAKLGEDWYRPQEISAFILMKMKAVAESAIGEEVRDAVVTVPAYFTEKQKKATREAAALAGLYPRQIIAEPTAAAICYGVDAFDTTPHVYAVYDLGGGTFDVSIITVDQTKVDVIATSGDSRLGGGDFDDAIVDWAIEELRTKHGVDSLTPIIRARLKHRAEEAKIALSTFETAMLPVADLVSLPPGVTSLELTRAIFEQLIEKPFIDPSLTRVDEALRIAKETKDLERGAVDAILLVGGSSKIPLVRNRLLDYFGKDESFIRSDLEGDTVVARGAATMALQYAASPPPFDMRQVGEAGLKNLEADGLPDTLLITEHSLGVELLGQKFDRIIPRGTTIPYSTRKEGYTNAGPSSELDIRVYQGESDHCPDNTLIGMVHLGPMEPRPEGHHRFAITFALDGDGLLAATVHHITDNKDYQERFASSAGVGGTEALEQRRAKLLSMYQQEPGAGIPSAPPPPTPEAAQARPAAPPAPPPEPGTVTPPEPAAAAPPAPRSPRPRRRPRRGGASTPACSARAAAGAGYSLATGARGRRAARPCAACCRDAILGWQRASPSDGAGPRPVPYDCAAFVQTTARSQRTRPYGRLLRVRCAAQRGCVGERPSRSWRRA